MLYRNPGMYFSKLCISAKAWRSERSHGGATDATKRFKCCSSTVCLTVFPCLEMGHVCIYCATHHCSHEIATQASHSVDRAGWQAKMASIEFCIP